MPKDTWTALLDISCFSTTQGTASNQFFRFVSHKCLFSPTSGAGKRVPAFGSVYGGYSNSALPNVSFSVEPFFSRHFVSFGRILNREDFQTGKLAQKLGEQFCGMI